MEDYFTRLYYTIDTATNIYMSNIEDMVFKNGRKSALNTIDVRGSEWWHNPQMYNGTFSDIELKLDKGHQAANQLRDLDRLRSYFLKSSFFLYLYQKIRDIGALADAIVNPSDLKLEQIEEDFKRYIRDIYAFGDESEYMKTLQNYESHYDVHAIYALGIVIKKSQPVQRFLRYADEADKWLTQKLQNLCFFIFEIFAQFTSSRRDVLMLVRAILAEILLYKDIDLHDFYGISYTACDYRTATQSVFWMMTAARLLANPKTDYSDAEILFIRLINGEDSDVITNVTRNQSAVRKTYDTDRIIKGGSYLRYATEYVYDRAPQSHPLYECKSYLTISETEKRDTYDGEECTMRLVLQKRAKR